MVNWMDGWSGLLSCLLLNVLSLASSSLGLVLGDGGNL